MPLIDDKLALRAALYYENRDGWVNSVAPVKVEPLNGVDAFAGRLTLLGKPTDTLTATLKASFSKSGGTPYGAYALNNDPSVTLRAHRPGSYSVTNGRIYFDSTTKRGFGAGIWIKNAFNTQ